MIRNSTTELKFVTSRQQALLTYRPVGVNTVPGRNRGGWLKRGCQAWGQDNNRAVKRTEPGPSGDEKARAGLEGTGTGERWQGRRENGAPWFSTQQECIALVMKG